MRAAVGFVAFCACVLLSMTSYGQDDPCSARIVSHKSTERRLTLAEVAHRVMVENSPMERRKIYWGDVEFILSCGTQQDATELFATVQHEYVRMVGATVFEAAANFVRVSWDDGFRSGGFRFNFDTPLIVIPKPGQKVIISGAYLSYSREPFQISLVN